MSETATSNGFVLDAENIARVYRGEPARVDEIEASDILTPRVLAVASYVSQGLTYQEIADTVCRGISTVRAQLYDAYARLGISSNYGLVAYLPPDPSEPLLEGKKFADLGDQASGLEILESLSVGMRHKAIARERGIRSSTLRTHIHNLGNAWPDARGSVRTLRVANGLRARYVQAIESASGTMEPDDIAQITLPRLARLEPAILERYPEV